MQINIQTTCLQVAGHQLYNLLRIHLFLLSFPASFPSSLPICSSHPPSLLYSSFFLPSLLYSSLPPPSSLPLNPPSLTGRQFHQHSSITSTSSRSSASPQSQQLEKPDKPLAERHPDSHQSDSPDFEQRPVSKVYPPDDATFPKHGAGLFTFADCLSNKSRRFHEGQ